MRKRDSRGKKKIFNQMTLAIPPDMTENAVNDKVIAESMCSC
jgi:hypothetical protein